MTRKPVPEALGPFRGLSAYDVADGDAFFGRKQDTEAALALLRDRGVVLLVGPSGAGKSSLARAGVLAALTDGAPVGPKEWDVAVIAAPSAPKAAALRALSPFADDAASLSPSALAARLAEHVKEKKRGLLVLADPLDDASPAAEPRRPPASDKDAAAGAYLPELLARIGAAAVPGLAAVGVVKSERLGALLALPGCGSLAGAALAIRPLTADAWAEVCEQGLGAYAYAFESAALRDELLAEIRDRDLPMPVVSFALTRAWEHRDKEKKRLTRAAVRAAGGVAHALDRHAEGLLERFDALAGPGRAKGKDVLLAVGAGRVRTEASIASVGGTSDVEATKRALRELVDAGFVVVGEGGESSLVHESLLQSAKPFAALVAEDDRERALATEIEREAAAWAKERGATAPSAKRAVSESVRARLSGQATAYLDAGERVERQRGTSLRFATSAAVAVVLLAAGAAVYARARETRATDEARDRKAEVQTFEQRARAEKTASQAWALARAEARIPTYEAALHEDGTWGDGYYLLSQARLERAEELDATDPAAAEAMRERAVEDAKAAIAYDAGPKGYLESALALAALGRRDAAHDAFMDAARTGSSEPFVYHAALAAAAEGEHRWADVIDETNKALSASPGDVTMLVRRALAELRTGKLDDALADVDAALRESPGRAATLALASDVHLVRGEAREAALALVQGAALDPRDPRILARLALAALARGAPLRAARLANAAVEAGEHVPDAFVARAEVHAAAGEQALATADVAAALSLDPLDEDARKLEAGDWPKARAPGDVPPHSLRDQALAALAKGKLDDAWNAATRALADDPLDAEARLALVRIDRALPDAPRSNRESAKDLLIVATLAPDLPSDLPKDKEAKP